MTNLGKRGSVLPQSVFHTLLSQGGASSVADRLRDGHRIVVHVFSLNLIT
jgi:hypothetical protein